MSSKLLREIAREHLSSNRPPVPIADSCFETEPDLPDPAAVRSAGARVSRLHGTASKRSDNETIGWTTTLQASRISAERMTMATSRLLLCTLCFMLLSCSGDKAKELLETAQFEERQMNLPHAKQLYEDIVRLYPKSPEAETARLRLADLRAGQ